MESLRIPRRPYMRDRNPHTPMAHACVYAGLAASSEVRQVCATELGMNLSTWERERLGQPQPPRRKGARSRRLRDR